MAKQCELMYLKPPVLRDYARCGLTGSAMETRTAGMRTVCTEHREQAKRAEAVGLGGRLHWTESTERHPA